MKKPNYGEVCYAHERALDFATRNREMDDDASGTAQIRRARLYVAFLNERAPAVAESVKSLNVVLNHHRRVRVGNANRSSG